MVPESGYNRLNKNLVTVMPTNVDKYFAYKHLPERLQNISKLFYELNAELDGLVPDCAEKSAGMRKLLEAKDCIVRAALD